MKVREFLNKLDDCILEICDGEEWILSISSTDVFKKMPEIENIEGNGDDLDMDLDITFSNSKWTFEQTKENWGKLMEAEVVHVYHGEDLEIKIAF